jgi:hypothetical protein
MVHFDSLLNRTKIGPKVHNHKARQMPNVGCQNDTFVFESRAYTEFPSLHVVFNLRAIADREHATSRGAATAHVEG